MKKIFYTIAVLTCGAVGSAHAFEDLAAPADYTVTCRCVCAGGSDGEIYEVELTNGACSDLNGKACTTNGGKDGQYSQCHTKPARNAFSF